jgi:DNA-binding PadR family transcriptional regulator
MNHRSNSRLAPEYVLLGFLYKNPGYGYELHRRLLRDFGNIWHSSQSQTYNILKRVEAQGYVTSTNVQQIKHPARQLLHITDSGRQRFDTWLMQPTKSSVHAIRVEFITRLYFLQMYYPERIEEMLQVQFEKVNASLKELQGELAKLPEYQKFERLALELRIKLLDSVMIWLNEWRESFVFKPSYGVKGE